MSSEMPQELRPFIEELHARLTVAQLGAIMAEHYEIEQILGKALGYPQAYPEVGEIDDGSVVVGPHTPVTLAMEASDLIAKLRKELEDAKASPR